MSNDLAVNDQQLLAYHELKSAMAQFSQSPNNLDKRQRKQIKQTAKRSLELENMILSSSLAQGVMIPPHSLQKSLAEIEERYENSDDFVKDLKSIGLTPDALQEAVSRELWVEVVLERVSSQVKGVNDEEVSTFYAGNIDKFTQPEKRKTRHILVTVNSDYTENTPEAVEKRLGDMLIAAREGADFAKLAAENSECPTAMNGGEVGLVPRGHLYPEIDEILFKLEEGEIGGPVKTEIGYHIVLCEKVYSESIVPLDEAHEKIVQYLTGKKKALVQKQWLSTLGAR